MQIELINLQKEVGITFVYVTHDQTEALALSHRIAVMNHGRVEQLDEPSRIYGLPATRFVADFIGHCNLLSGPVTSGADGVVALDVPGIGVVRAAAQDDRRDGRRRDHRAASGKDPHRDGRAVGRRRQPLARHGGRSALHGRRDGLQGPHRGRRARSRRCWRIRGADSPSSSRSATASRWAGRPTPATSSPSDGGDVGRAARSAMGQVDGGRAAAALPDRLLRAAHAHHGAGVVPLARRIRRPRAVRGRRRRARPDARELRAARRGHRVPRRSS